MLHKEVLPVSFTHLQVKSSYSLLSSLNSISALVSSAQNNRFTSLALTDQNVMYGSIPFYNACKKNDIKPIIGLEASVEYSNEISPLLIYAKNNNGYKNILEISSEIKTNNNESISLELLSKYMDGTLLIIPSKKSFIDKLLKINEIGNTIEFINSIKLINNDIYLGISVYNQGDKLIYSDLYSVANRCAIKTVFINDTLYINKEDGKFLEYAQAIKNSEKITYTNKSEIESSNYFKSEAEIKMLDPKLEAFNNVSEVVDKCNVNLEFGEFLVPKFPLENGIDSKTYLQTLCFKGLKKRYGNNLRQIHIDRLKYELKIIIDMNFQDYFLIVYDFIKYAKHNDILVGPGRGSAASSIVSYCLGITGIDPIEYNLYFERFLNPERITMPDIDIDFPDDRRDEVIEYVADKYGKDKTAHIVTFGTLSAKQVIRDVGRVMDIPLKLIDQVSKSIPNQLNIKLIDAYKNEKKFRDIINNSNELRRLFEISCALEGLPRHTSLHAAGIILSDIKLSTITGIQYGTDSLYSTQLTMKYLEEMGLLKIDFLGLRNLSIIKNIIRLIEKEIHHKIDLSKIPLDDEATLEIFRTANTNGVFQFESSGMRNVLVKLRPQSFEDIVAANALFRPGPMENIDEFVKRKHGEIKVTYIHKDLEEILNNTYGIIVYQEQILKIVQIIGGYTLGEADVLRRAVGKKNAEVLNAERVTFVKKSIANGYQESVANEIYDLIVKFSNYGFVRSHSVAYSLVGYQLAYLKANYRIYFMSSLLSGVVSSTSKIYDYIRECRKYNIQVLLPSVNKSIDIFSVESLSIRYSLLAIKNIGYAVYRKIELERQNGLFKDFFDFVIRMNKQSMGKNIIETLIDAGALDEFDETRSTFHNNLENVIKYAELVGSDDDVQLSLDASFIDKPIMKRIVEFNNDELVRREKDALGLYLNGHPLEKYRDKYQQAVFIKNFPHYDGKRIKTLIIIDKIKRIKTKKNDDMAFIDGVDEESNGQFTLFPKQYQMYPVEVGEIYIVFGKVEKRLSSYQFVIESMKKIGIML